MICSWAERAKRVWPPHSAASKLLCLQMLTNPTQTQFLLTNISRFCVFFHKHILLISHKNNTCERMTNNGHTKAFVSGLWAFWFLMYLLIKHMIRGACLHAQACTRSERIQRKQTFSDISDRHGRLKNAEAKSH